MRILIAFPWNWIGSLSCWASTWSSASLTMGLLVWALSKLSRPKDGIRWQNTYWGKRLLGKWEGCQDSEAGEGQRDRGFGRSILDLSAVLRRFLEPESLPEECEVSQKQPLRILWHSVIGPEQPWEVWPQSGDGRVSGQSSWGNHSITLPAGNWSEACSPGCHGDQMFLQHLPLRAAENMPLTCSKLEEWANKQLSSVVMSWSSRSHTQQLIYCFMSLLICVFGVYTYRHRFATVVYFQG